MASAAQTLANQTNAQSSTGPRTAEGKARSARNAVKHGLSASFNVLAHEDQDEFDALIEELREEYLPVTSHQVFLVDQLAQSIWMVARATRLLNAAFNLMTGLPLDEDDPDTAIVRHMSKTNPNAFQTLERHLKNSESSYYRAYRELTKAKQIQNEADFVAGVQRIRSDAAQRLSNAPLPIHPAHGPEPERTQFGFLPQNSPATEHLREQIRQGQMPLA
jgi:uncharacterized short protein YbdD (DUF466 family)